MANAHSYTITVANNKTENEGVKHLLSSDVRFIKPSKESRKIILDILKLDSSFSRAFDLIMVKGHTSQEQNVTLDKPQDITLIELKTTKKKLPKNPKGFFFGATENEFKLAEKLGVQYKFCFVSLHADSAAHVLLTLAELNKLINKKRIQYQINLS